jgi:hypothetical protein
MRFLSIYKIAEMNTPPSPDFMSRMQKLVEDGFKKGWLVATEGCLPSALGASVRSSGGKMIVTDGPFTETKELIAGFALLQVSSKDEAVRLAQEFLAVAGEGECELRQIFTPSEPGAGACSAELAEQFGRG